MIVHYMLSGTGIKDPEEYLHNRFIEKIEKNLKQLIKIYQKEGSKGFKEEEKRIGEEGKRLGDALASKLLIISRFLKGEAPLKDEDKRFIDIFTQKVTKTFISLFTANLTQEDLNQIIDPWIAIHVAISTPTSYGPYIEKIEHVSDKHSLLLKKLSD